MVGVYFYQRAGYVPVYVPSASTGANIDFVDGVRDAASTLSKTIMSNLLKTIVGTVIYDSTNGSVVMWLSRLSRKDEAVRGWPCWPQGAKYYLRLTPTTNALSPRER